MDIDATSTKEISHAKGQEQTSKEVSWLPWQVALGSLLCALGFSRISLVEGRQSCAYANPSVSPRSADPQSRTATIIWDVGCIIVAASQNIPMLIVGRVFNGFCVGICSAQVPVYISEVAQPSKRGRLIGAQQWAITWGIMIMF